MGLGTVSSGALNGSALVSDPFVTLGAQPTNSNVIFSGTPLADPSNPGRYTMSPLQVTIGETISDFNLAIYQANGGQLFWLNEDPSSVFLGSLQQQGSLAGLPGAAIKGAAATAERLKRQQQSK